MDHFSRQRKDVLGFSTQHDEEVDRDPEATQRDRSQQHQGDTARKRAAARLHRYNCETTTTASYCSTEKPPPPTKQEGYDGRIGSPKIAIPIPAARRNQRLRCLREGSVSGCRVLWTDTAKHMQKHMCNIQKPQHSLNQKQRLATPPQWTSACSIAQHSTAQNNTVPSLFAVRK